MSGIATPSLTLGDAPERRFECSRAGCREEARWAILWRNPKIHGPERRKTWLACDEHRETLYAFLEARSFPLEVRAVGELDD
ncbi:hypothetical protein [Leucobacter chromiiresistens]|uniref:Acetone carboxylase n=1 Tax=Leucobacter chromiiresistens TaxID=1079994 RepID=A0A1H0ZU03_9MICO|nr:hypothetical protein [Leucobacter chromiiresistens]SDQ30536.1 hypothetical protein SAMN04488565_2038 [Leucobacter chromiiresistens]